MSPDTSLSCSSSRMDSGRGKLDCHRLAYSYAACQLRLLLAGAAGASRFRHVDVEVAGGVGMLELNRGVMDAEPGGQHVAQALGDELAFGSGYIQNADVAGERLALRAEAPDVHVVHFANALHAEHGGRYLLQVHPLREAFEQNVGRIADDAGCRP